MYRWSKAAPPSVCVKCKLDACQLKKKIKARTLTEEQNIAKWRLYHAASCHGNRDGNRANCEHKPRSRIDPHAIYDIMRQKRRYTQVWHLNPGVEERKKEKVRASHPPLQENEERKAPVT